MHGIQIFCFKLDSRTTKYGSIDEWKSSKENKTNGDLKVHSKMRWIFLSFLPIYTESVSLKIELISWLTRTKSYNILQIACNV